MKLTRQYLRKLIKEEHQKLLEYTRPNEHNIIPGELHNYYVKGTFKYKEYRDDPSYNYEYSLLIPYEKGETETENDIKTLLSSAGLVNSGWTPGYHFVRFSFNIRKKGSNWAVDVWCNGGLDV